jgi:hypothetical protein
MYRQVIIQSYKAAGQASGKSVRARPIAGQGLDTAINVECSAKMRNAYPVGTLFEITAKLTDREHGSPFLYTHHTWSFKVISQQEAGALIAGLAL